MAHKVLCRPGPLSSIALLRGLTQDCTSVSAQAFTVTPAGEGKAGSHTKQRLLWPGNGTCQLHSQPIGRMVPRPRPCVTSRDRNVKSFQVSRMTKLRIIHKRHLTFRSRHHFPGGALPGPLNRRSWSVEESQFFCVVFVQLLPPLLLKNIFD